MSRGARYVPVIAPLSARQILEIREIFIDIVSSPRTISS
jgi:hypothetical protein